MRIDLFNIDEFIKLNKCPQVTNPVFFNFDQTPTREGLFSYDLFGVSDNERKNIFGYVDLRDHYIHPLIYSMMRGRMGGIRDILSGTKHAIILKGKITIVPEDYEGADTGLDFLYRNYEKINWLDEVEEEEEDSVDKKTRLSFLKSIKKDEFFITKWLIVPPFYRSQSSEDQTIGDEINALYKDLISRTNAMRTGFGIKLFGDETKLKIQNILLEIFTETTRPVKGKNSLLRKHLLGKTIDFTSSNVITAPEISKANRPEDMPVQFGYSAFPLATVISLFNPFYLNFITDYLSRLLRNIQQVFANEIETINLNQFNVEYAEKLIKLFITSEGERFNEITFEFVDKNNKKIKRAIALFEFRNKDDLKNNKYIQRTMTYTDLFFMASDLIAKDKHVYVTRYPAINFQNIYPSKIKLLTTVKTLDTVYLKFDPQSEYYVEYKNYPYIKVEGKNEKNIPLTHYGFINVMIPGNVYISAMGGDYDGDMFYMRGVFSKEANEEAAKLIFAKSNMLDASGGPARGIKHISKEALISLFELTKENGN
jgi:hypothetical protein